MSESSPLFWSCPACGRRVPLRVDRCHCGRMRDVAGGEPERLLARPSQATVARRQAVALWRSLPRDVKAFVVAGTLVVAAGVGWTLFGPRQSETIPPVLGYLDATPPAPTPRPPKSPPLKLPWWR
jgi:hypothetical protein